MKNYQTKVIVGTQWGDEGKGKICDYLARQADVVVRFQGGNNAGHSIKIKSKKFALNHLPSGVLNPQTTNVLAQGVVINPPQLINEIRALKAQRINNFKLLISDKAHLIMPYHLDLDVAFEKIKKSQSEKSQIGTTKKGIGPAYVDKVARIGIRMGDFVDVKAFKQVLKGSLLIKNKQLKAFDLKSYQLEKLFDEYKNYAKQLKPYMTNTSRFLIKAIESEKKILFEGAQGTMLCYENGTYPFVTSSSPTLAGLPLGTGLNPFYIKKVIGVVKAYSTRVGGGHMITELSKQEEAITNHIQTTGNEFGTVTKRPRRIGWLDILALKHAIQISGITNLAITLVDVLSGLSEIKMATSYLLNGKEIDYVPSSIFEYEKCEPRYITLKGWNQNISNAKSMEDLPQAAQNFLKTIEKLTKVKIAIVSVGPGRNQTIQVNDF